MKRRKNKMTNTKPSCQHCGSKNVYGMSRVVGYYSIIENWNGSKQAELKDRQKGYYKLGESVPNQAKTIEEAKIECVQAIGE